MTMWPLGQVSLLPGHQTYRTFISCDGRTKPDEADAVVPFEWTNVARFKPNLWPCRMMWSTQCFQALGAHGMFVFIKALNIVEVGHSHSSEINIVPKN